jgi:tetratricopeptide (TPR) repeat protein
MNSIQDLHREAMQWVDQAEQLRREGDAQSAQERLQRAFEYERQAAERSAGDLSLEPTRSILHRSAASLALECGKYREAERLIAVALAGNPPDAIAEELRDLLVQVYFERPSRSRRRTLTGSAAGKES